MRQPKPFFRKFTQSWYVTIDGKQLPLGRDEAEAWQKYHQLMAGRQELSNPGVTVAQLFEAYLQWVQVHRSQGTYDNTVHYLSHFTRFVGKGFRVSSLDGAKVSKWIDSHPEWSSTSANDAVSIVQRAFNWAVKKGHLVRSPVQFVPDKPPRKRRETVYTTEQWRELRSLVKDQQFGDLLDFMWETGCRPKEARMIEARHIDLGNDLILFPPSEAKGETRERVIFLTDKAEQICERLMAQHPTGPIFRNTRGKAWTKDSINCRFQRLKEKVDFPVCAYGIRHSYATEGLKSGMDSLTIAQLMGHADGTMISRCYAHLARNPSYLREQAKKLKASGDSS